MNSLYLRYKSIAVFNKTAAELAPLAELIVCTDVARRVELAACVFRAAAERGCDCTGEWIKSIVMSDDNVFSRAAARGERVSDRLKAQVKSELLTFKQMSLIKPKIRVRRVFGRVRKTAVVLCRKRLRQDSGGQRVRVARRRACRGGM